MAGRVSPGPGQGVAAEGARLAWAGTLPTLHGRKASLLAGNTANVFPPLAASQVAIGMPATTNAGNGYVAPAEVNKALDCLTKAVNCGSYVPRSGPQPNLRGLMTWSINWDATNNWSFSRTVKPHLATLP